MEPAGGGAGRYILCGGDLGAPREGGGGPGVLGDAPLFQRGGTYPLGRPSLLWGMHDFFDSLVVIIDDLLD